MDLGLTEAEKNELSNGLAVENAELLEKLMATIRRMVLGENRIGLIWLSEIVGASFVWAGSELDKKQKPTPAAMHGWSGVIGRA